MKSTEQLKEEHEAIKLMLKILEKVCEKLESGEKVNHEDIDKIVEFIKDFADRCHHLKEEKLLFPAMEEAGVPKERGPISVMLMEHDEGRGYVRGMSEAIVKYKSGDYSASSEIVKNVRGYIELLTQHINKEDNILYPMADMRFSEEKDEELLKEFEIVEQERIGLGRHKELHKFLEDLEKTYLG
ncbi:MAG: hemerythrin domain-containing protein [Actinobacteria bacterium]|nr:hemerythrin domain-containing protein [Actinomycetota bacterium]